MQSSNSISKNRKVVMVCEDEQELLELYSKVLGLKYDVIKVCSGEDCIKKYIEEKTKGSGIDLLLLDYRLGDMLGGDVAKKIKGLNGIKIILISAYDLENEMKKDLLDKKYIDNFLQKPLKIKQILEEATKSIC